MFAIPTTTRRTGTQRFWNPERRFTGLSVGRLVKPWQPSATARSSFTRQKLPNRSVPLYGQGQCFTEVPAQKCGPPDKSGLSRARPRACGLLHEALHQAPFVGAIEISRARPK